MALLRRMKNSIKNYQKRITNSLIYKLTKSNIRNNMLAKELESARQNYLIKERKYIDELNIRKLEIRYVDLQMARVTKYINSTRYMSASKEESREHLIDLIKGNKYEW